MAVWIKPSGAEITTNDEDATLEAAVKHGWKLKKDKPKKRGRPKKKED